MSHVLHPATGWSLRRFVGNDGAFTLVELVVASSILFITAMGVISSIEFSAVSTAQTAARSHALNLANQVLEQARNLPYDSVGIIFANGSLGDPPGAIPATSTVDGYGVMTEVRWTTDAESGRSAYKNIKITVSWTKPLPGTVSVASAVYGKSAVTNTGDLRVMVKEVGTDNRIRPAQVDVTPSGTSTDRSVGTDTSGTVFFGALPIGLTPVRVSASGWLFDDAALATVTIAPDLVTSVVAYGYRPCTATITVIDGSGAPIPEATVSLRDSRGRTRVWSGAAGGVFGFPNLLPDTWQVTVTAPGRASATGIIASMVSGASYTLCVALTESVPPGSLRVRVRTAAGAMIPGASVAVRGPAPGGDPIAGSPSATPVGAPTSGEVFFTSVVSGTYTITVTTAGYRTSSVSVTVVSGVEHLAVVTMPLTTSSAGSLRVRVLVGGAVPLESRAVWASGGPSPNVQRFTDNGGFVTFDDLLVGQYQISTDGAASQTVQITGGQTAEATLSSN